ncbi:hypothetical protein D3C85_1457550 [compost metagenome]
MSGALRVDSINVDQTDLDVRNRWILLCSFLFIGILKYSSRHIALIAVPAVGAIYVQHFLQRVGQLLPARRAVPLVVPER